VYRRANIKIDVTAPEQQLMFVPFAHTDRKHHVDISERQSHTHAADQSLHDYACMSVMIMQDPLDFLLFLIH
jgi:hypothetical protein